MTFRDYIRTCRAPRSPIGDFVRDARSDPTLPEPYWWPDLRAHLVQQGAIPEAIAAGYQCWRNYQSAVARELRRANRKD
jgi:hypothetical protein